MQAYDSEYKAGLAADEILDEEAEAVVNAAKNECYHNGNNEHHDRQVKNLSPREPGHFFNFGDNSADKLPPGAHRLGGSAVSH